MSGKGEASRGLRTFVLDIVRKFLTGPWLSEAAAKINLGRLPDVEGEMNRKERRLCTSRVAREHREHVVSRTFEDGRRNSACNFGADNSLLNLGSTLVTTVAPFLTINIAFEAFIVHGLNRRYGMPVLLFFLRLAYGSLCRQIAGIFERLCCSRCPSNVSLFLSRR